MTRRHPYDRDLLFALASYQREAGDTAKARTHARLLVELEPEQADFRALARALEGDAAAR